MTQAVGFLLPTETWIEFLNPLQALADPITSPLVGFLTSPQVTTGINSKDSHIGREFVLVRRNNQQDRDADED